MKPAAEHTAKPSNRIFCTEDARRLARRRLPRLVYDFIEGAAGRETAAGRNEAAFDDLFLQPRVMGDIAERSLRTTLLGRSYDLPFGIAPMGMCNLSWPGADHLIGKAAKRHNIPACLSSAASSSIEEMRGWAGENAWFQLYVGQSMDLALEMVDRASEAGYETLVLTVDVPQVSRRVRDLRNGFQMPFRMGAKQVLDFALHPAWALTTLRHGAPEPKNFRSRNGGSKFDRSASRAGADWDFLDRLRDMWKGHLIVKGVTSVPDALRIKASGADAVYVSNHGGRQLDGAPPPLTLLPQIRAAVGAEYPLLFDSGVRSGEDVVKALAAGADFVMIGRPVLFALGAEAGAGLEALIRCFAEDADLALAQLGLRDTASLGQDAVFGARPCA